MLHRWSSRGGRTQSTSSPRSRLTRAGSAPSRRCGAPGASSPSILNLSWIAHWPILWGTYLADAALQFALGLLLGVGVLKTFIKNPSAQVRMDQTLTRLAPHQGRLGLTGMAVGAWMIVAGFLWRMG